MFYLGPDGRVMSFPVSKANESLDFGTPTPLFTGPSGNNGGFEAAPDGQRFLFSVRVEDPAPITILLNWAGLRR